MRTVMASPRCVLAGAVLGSAALLGSSALICSMPLPAQEVVPSVRIVNRIDEHSLVTLKGNTHPAAKAMNDRGRVSADLPMTDLILVLSRSAQQQAAFEKYVASEYDSSSPNFHQWLTPEAIGQKYGPSEADIATISQWLGGHGFTVDEVPSDRMTIRFSGTAGMVESAFHTEIHNLDVKGVAHIANMSDPQIPAALAPVVLGVKALHNFFPHPLHKMVSQVQRDNKTGKWARVTSGTGVSKPATVRTQYTTSDSYGDLLEDVGPYDFATIYNVLPLWTASTPINGSGQTIAIAGTSDIDLADVTSFRSTFGLPAYTTNAPIQQVVHGPDPGDCPGAASASSTCAGDLIENSLDVEWSGAIAPAAQIFLAVSGANSTTDDTVWDSSNYVIENQATVNASILNVSFGECELGEGVAGNLSYYNLWQTAYASGIAVFVAAGDSGSASCDDGGDQEYGTPYAAEYGLSVSGLASTPYNTAVGGTDLLWCPVTASSCTAAPYWNKTNNSTNSNALGYIPEIPWNNTCAGAAGAAYLYWISQPAQTDLGGVTDAESACNFVVSYYQYIYQAYGIDISGFVDTIGGSGGASGCIVSDANGDVSSCGSATTTGASYGNIPLHNDGWGKPIWQTGVEGIPQDGVRDLPDVSFFASNGFLGSAYLICVSAVASCTYSSQTEPLAQEVGGTSVATPAMAGVMALINQKTGSIQGNPNTEFYKLATMQNYSNCSAETVTNSSSCYFNDIDAGNISIESTLIPNNNSVPCDYASLSPNCGILYSIDNYGVGILGTNAGNPGYSAGKGYDLATGLGSLNVANVVNSFVGIGNHPALVTVTPAQISINANQSLSVTVTVSSAYIGGGTPSGTVTLSGGGFASSPEMIDASGTYVFSIPSNSLSVGSGIVLTSNYSGDVTYAQESNTAVVTVIQEPTFTLAAPATEPTVDVPGGNVTAAIAVAAVAGYTGTVTFSSTSCQLTSSAQVNSSADTPTCTAPSGSVAMGGSANFTVNTKAPSSAALIYPKVPGKGWAGGGAVLALLLFLGMPARRRSWRSMLGLLLLMAVLSSLSACGGGSSSSVSSGDPGTAAGSYTFTVTATGNPTVSPAPSVSFVVQVY